MEKAHCTSRNPPRQELKRKHSGLDRRIIGCYPLDLLWRASIDFQPAKIATGGTGHRTCRQQYPLIVKLGKVRQVSILQLILLLLTQLRCIGSQYQQAYSESIELHA